MFFGNSSPLFGIGAKQFVVNDRSLGEEGGQK